MVATVSLPPSKTYKYRYVTFVRVTPKDRPPAGVIEIREATRETSKPKCTRYALCVNKQVESRLYEHENGDQEDLSDQDRAFRLTKSGGEVYYDLFIADMADGGEYDCCDCRGFDKSGTCKHVQALRALLNAGHL